jgi:prophage maintenance system killer protein
VCSGDEAHHLTGVRDGYRHYLETFVRPRDPARAERLITVLALVREESTPQLVLNAARLAKWHQLAVGPSASALRTTAAFAKNGRERYGMLEPFESTFSACVKQATDDRWSLSARATRVYFDVLFFHPFNDGNARLAALTLESVLARQRVRLSQVAPLFTVQRCAADPRGIELFMQLLEKLIAVSDARNHGD